LELIGTIGHIVANRVLSMTGGRQTPETMVQEICFGRYTCKTST
jgi:hypothetical protein